MTPKTARGAVQELRIGLGRVRADPATWPWPARLDHFLSTRPLIEMIVAGPQRHLGGFRDWSKTIGQIFTTTFLTARGRAFMRWQWDAKHRGGQRSDLRRRYLALDRLNRIRSKYWLQDWYLDED